MLRGNSSNLPFAVVALILCLGFIAVSQAQAQRTPAYPQRAVDAEAVARGKDLYEGYACAFCHGADTRGGNGGPSLLRSQLVQRDQKGELIGPVIREGRPNTTMLGFSLSDAQIADIAEFLHSFELESRDPSRLVPESIVVGNAEAGRAYFNQVCAQCHSLRDDLQGLTARFPDPLDLQTHWIMPGSPSPTMATVRLRDGSVFVGELDAVDEFRVSINKADGSRQTFNRRTQVAQVEITDPLQPHVDLLEVYSDADIHNVTAYLVNLEE